MALYLLDSLVFVFGCQAKRDAIPLIWRRLEYYGKYEKIELHTMIASHVPYSGMWTPFSTQGQMYRNPISLNESVC